MDLLVLNANVLTMNDAAPRATAFAVDGQRISAVGDSADLLGRGDATTRVLDLGGRTVVPGFIDAHSHFGPLVISTGEIDLTRPPLRDIPDLQERLRRAAGGTPAGQWIRGFGYGENLLAEQRHPTRWELDEAVPDHPVIVIHWGYHRLVANSLALDLAGVRKGRTEIAHGVIHCDESGEPNGLLTEAGTNTALQAAIDAVMQTNAGELSRWIEATCQQHLAQGITGVHDAWVSPKFEDMFRAAAHSGHLPIYYTPLRGHYQGLFGSPGPWLEPGRIDGSSLPPHIRRGGIKLFASGVWENVLYYSQTELNDLVERAHRQNLTVAMHVSSNPGTEMAIQAVEHARRTVPGGEGRIRLEHFFWGTDSDIDRLGKANAVVVTQPASMTRFGARVQPSAEGVHRIPIASLDSAGVPVSFSSDAPCFPVPPLIGVGAAVTRMSSGGAAIAPEQAVSVEAALRMYTLGSAWADGTEDDEGSIEPGKLANFVVLAEDPMAIAAERIAGIVVEQTWVDGVKAYERAST